MIEIITLLHGLLMGPMAIELRVPPETARVEVQLDDQVLAERTAPPWTLEVPFPEEPKPRRLTVTAFDTNGRTLDRQSRSLNVDMADCQPPGGAPPQGATPFFIDLEPGAAELSAADMAGWFKVDGKAVDVLDIVSGPVEIVVVQDPATQKIFDRLSLTFLRERAGLDPPRSVSDEANQELLLTAVNSLSLGAPDLGPSPEESALREAIWLWRQLISLELDGRIQFFWPSGPPIASLKDQTDVFPFIGPYNVGRTGLLWWLREAVKFQGELRLADAVAVAGYQVASRCRRRAVLLFESVWSVDASLLDAAAVRGYLRSVQVPLLVLRDLEHESTGVEADAALDPERWGQVLVLHPWRDELRGHPALLKLGAFHSRVEQSLERQRIVWLAGRYLPQEIQFEAGRPGYAAAGQREMEAYP